MGGRYQGAGGDAAKQNSVLAKMNSVLASVGSQSHATANNIGDVDNEMAAWAMARTQRPTSCIRMLTLCLTI